MLGAERIFDIVRRTDGRIEVTLTNLEVAVEDATCGTDRPTVVTVVPLGSDFAAGETYMIVVNEEPMEPFVAR